LVKNTFARVTVFLKSITMPATRENPLVCPPVSFAIHHMQKTTKRTYVLDFACYGFGLAQVHGFSGSLACFWQFYAKIFNEISLPFTSDKCSAKIFNYKEPQLQPMSRTKLISRKLMSIAWKTNKYAR
jgi:hypothetical protein